MKSRKIFLAWKRTHDAVLRAPTRPQPSAGEGADATYSDLSNRLRDAALVRHLAAVGSGIDVWERDLVNGTATFTALALQIFGIDPVSLANGEVAPPGIEDWIARIHPDDDPAAQMTRYADHLAGRLPYLKSEYRVRCADGEYRWVRVVGRVAERDGSGQPSRMVGTTEDIHERKLSELELEAKRVQLDNAMDALNRSERLFRAAFEHAPLGLAIHDGTLRAHYLGVNDAYCRIVGYTRDQLIGMSPDELIASDEPHHDVEQIQLQARQSAGRVSVVRRHVRSDGKPIDLQVHVSLLDGEQDSGDVSAVSIIEDVTELLETRQALAVSETRATLAIENARIGLWDWDIELDSMFYSDRTLEILGAPQENFRTADDWVACLHPDDRAVYRDAQAAHFESRSEHYECELRIRHGDGHYKWVSDRGKVVRRDDAGQPLRIIGTLMNIDTRKRADQALRESEARFRGIFETTRHVISVLDRDGRHIGTNPMGYEFTGLTVDEKRSLYFWEGHWWLSEADRERVRDAVRRAADGEYVQFEIGQCAADGRVMTSDLALWPLRGEGGEVVRIFAKAHDITPLKETQAALEDSQRFFRASFENTPVGFAIVVGEGVVVDANSAMCEILRYQKAELVGKSFREMTVPDDPTRPLAAMLDRLKAGNGRAVVEKRYVRGDGVVIQARSHLVVTAYGDDGQPSEAFLMIEDITERVQREAALHEARELAQVTLTSLVEGVIRTDLTGEVTLCNGTAAKLMGMEIADIVGRPITSTLQLLNLATATRLPCPAVSVLESGEPVRISDFVGLQATGQRRRVVTISCSALHAMDGKILGTVTVLQDAEKVYALTEALATQAAQDELTGLLNRRGFMQRLEQAVADVGRYEQALSLLYVDLDRFKLVNDACGHDAGDRLLAEVARLLRLHARSTDTVGRLGGDEFVLLLHGVEEDQALAIANRIIDSLNTYRFVHEGRAFTLGASAGLASVCAETANAATGLAWADAACRAAKREGRGRVSVYRPDAASIVDARMATGWSYRIQEGLEKGNFRLFLQKIVSADGEILGYEALARFVDSSGETVGPHMFLSAAKRFDLMTRIDRAIFNQALPLLGDLHALRPGASCPYLSVNLGARSIADPLFQNWLIERLADNLGVAATLWIEITELEEISWTEEELAFVAILRSHGVRIYLDDFGTGYNSFDVLKRIAVDGIKIDRSVTSDIMSGAISQALVKAAVSISADMELDLVAEGIEDDATLQFLRRLGVSKFQGFFFHRPEPAACAIRTSSPTRCS
ncbi:PAS domain-containing protein [Paraburkholderia lacunae]|uniref:GGDEF domain-containing protein n=1 Tax=Paraburkholderia lacunae TaxID=2211104 RepID=A0A370N329_9BURK|nr:PAS domain-containing protein [Paraburkholderia lacunae]RDK00032.1 GGDEF domain-containing protein [Paraburkholderia lacunae]